MNFNAISYFLETCSSRLENSWNLESLDKISALKVPDFLTGRQDSILQADMVTLWTQWFLESIYDPRQHIDESQEYAHIIDAVNRRVPYIFPHIEVSKRRQLVEQISFLINEEIQRYNYRHERLLFDFETKQLLWDIYGQDARCWICGYGFSQWAIDRFLNRGSAQDIPNPTFIDYLKPHGLKKRDFRIEIDHVIPLSSGGANDLDNLRLACGWCNAYKSNHLSIYDVDSSPDCIHHPNLGQVGVPRHFWTVRLLALIKKCEYEEGCDKDVSNSDLTITSSCKSGAMNPINLRVTCLEHDHIGSNRFISRTVAEQLFGGRP